MNLKRKLLDVLFIVVLGVLSVALLLAAQSYSAPAVKRFRETRLAPDPDCAVCAEGKPFPGYIDYQRFCAAG